jgi:hypothetical protein
VCDRIDDREHREMGDYVRDQETMEVAAAVYATVFGVGKRHEDEGLFKVLRYA